ncbi:MAG: amino acid--tRNA ligase-related protein [Pseudomonadota bacterium]
MLRRRAAALSDIRAFFAERNVLEVQTPVLAPATVTDPHVDAIPAGDGFLQTSPEYAMKRLLAAGAPSIYQLGPAFRAGERGRLHNPEFTLLEWYRLGYDDQALMQEVAALVDRLLGSDQYTFNRYDDLLAQSPAPAHEPEELRLAAAIESLSARRVFITHYPAEQAALARLHEQEPGTAARFELVVDGVELANGYHELGDEAQLRARFDQDNEVRRRLGKPERALDEAFLAAMAAGLPDCAGVALGVDRLLLLAFGARELREVLAFD